MTLNLSMSRVPLRAYSHGAWRLAMTEQITLCTTSFAAADLEGIALQPAQARYFGAGVVYENGAALEALGPAFTARRGDTIVACWGLVDIWPGRADCWALLAADIGPAGFGALHRQVAVGLDEAGRQGYRRLETTVDPDFPPARRWVRLLGFAFEGRLRRYTPDGRDMLIYARIRT